MKKYLLYLGRREKDTHCAEIDEIDFQNHLIHWQKENYLNESDCELLGLAVYKLEVGQMYTVFDDNYDISPFYHRLIRLQGE